MAKEILKNSPAMKTALRMIVYPALSVLFVSALWFHPKIQGFLTPKPSIIGAWIKSDDPGKGAQVFLFKPDGIFIEKYRDFNSPQNRQVIQWTGTWEIEDNVLVMNYSSGNQFTIKHTYKHSLSLISRDRVVLIGGLHFLHDGIEAYTYKRLPVNKFERYLPPTRNPIRYYSE